MSLNHVYINLNISDEHTESLKKQFNHVVDAIEKNRFVSPSDLNPLCDLLSEIINNQDQFVSICENKLNSGDFFVIHIQHKDPEILNLPWLLAKDYLSNKRIEDIRQIYLMNDILDETGKPFSDISADLASLPLKILVMVSSPIDSTYKQRLDYETEENAILHAFESLLQKGEVEIHFTNNGSLEELNAKVSLNHYHILHFSGHGTFQNGQGYLLLEDEFTLKSKLTKGNEFAKALLREDGRRIPFILLSACQSAAGSVEKGFNSITKELLEHGFPNVSAMSMSVLDVYATKFAQSFYDKINQGQSLLYAFYEAIRVLKQFELKRLQDNKQLNLNPVSPFQYAIPKLYTRTKDYQIIDTNAQKQKIRLEFSDYILRNSKFNKKINNFLFIGRRKEKSEILNPLFNHEPVLIKGMGGVGKTSMAIHMAQRYMARNPKTSPFFFNEETFKPDNIMKMLQKYILKNYQENTRADLELFDTGTEKVTYLFQRILDHGSTPLILFDNLDTFQKDEFGGSFQEEYVEQIINSLCDENRYPIILTSRYDLPDIKSIKTRKSLNEINITDFWKKCLQLEMGEMIKTLPKPLDISETFSKDKQLSFYNLVEILHNAFGGNYRALEFFNEIYKREKQDIYKTINELRVIPEKYKAETLLKMGENLVFKHLVNNLSLSQKQVLYILAHFNISVQETALSLQFSNINELNEKQSKQIQLHENIFDDLKILHLYTLIEISHEYENNRIHFYVTPIVKGLLNINTPESILKEIEESISFSHQIAGQYYYAILKNQRVDDLIVNSEAFMHFYQAKNIDKLNEIGKSLANYYYTYSFFHNSLTFCKKVENVCREKTDTWIYNQIGIIYIDLGKYKESLLYLEKKLVIDQEQKDREGEISTLNNISQIHKEQGDYETALLFLKQSLENSQEIEDRRVEVVTLLNIADIYSERGDNEIALLYLKQSLKISREIGDRQGEDSALFQISMIHKLGGDDEKVLRDLEKRLVIRGKRGDLKDEGISSSSIGTVYYERGDYETALRYYELSLKIRREIGNPKGEGTTLNNIGLIHSAQGDYETALQYYEQSLGIIREIGYRMIEDTILTNIGQIHSARGDYETALQYFEQSLKISRKKGDHNTEGSTLNNISQIYDAQGDYNTALRYLEQSLEILREVGDRRREAMTLNNISEIYNAQSDYETALPYLEQSLKIRREIGYRENEDTILNNISQIHKKRGNYETALLYLEQSLEISREIGNKKGDGTVLDNIGQIHLALCNYETALRYLEQSLEIRREIGDIDGEGTTLNNIGLVHARNDYETALQYFEQSLGIRREIGGRIAEGTVLDNIGQIHYARGDYGTALRYLEQSLEIRREIGDRKDEATSLNMISNIHYAQGDYETALRYYELSLEIRREIGDRQDESTILNNIGLIHHALGDYELALRYLEQSLEIKREIDDLRGMCVTLSIMGSIHLRDKNVYNAITTWIKTYSIAKKIGYAQVLSSLESLAKSLGGNDLSFWDKKASEMNINI